MFAIAHDRSHGEDSHCGVQVMEELDRVVESIHDEDVILLSKTDDNTARCPQFINEQATVIPCIYLCMKNISSFRLTQQERLDPPLDGLILDILLDSKSVLGGNHSFIKADVLLRHKMVSELWQ